MKGKLRIYKRLANKIYHTELKLHIYQRWKWKVRNKSEMTKIVNS